jgi:hypothetical protein
VSCQKGDWQSINVDAVGRKGVVYNALVHKLPFPQAKEAQFVNVKGII